MQSMINEILALLRNHLSKTSAKRSSLLWFFAEVEIQQQASIR